MVSLPPAQEPKYKGAGLKSFLAALESLRGPAVVEKTLACCEPEIADALRYKLASSGWYPLAWSCAVHAAAQQATGEGPALARTIGREGMRLDLSGIYRIFLVVISPQAIIGKSARLFSSFYSQGTMTVRESRSGTARVVWEGCEGFDRNVWEDLLGSCEASLELCGAKQLRIRYVSGARDGDTSAEMQAFWS